jgi:hypothetical protein
MAGRWKMGSAIGCRFLRKYALPVRQAHVSGRQAERGVAKACGSMTRYFGFHARVPAQARDRCRRAARPKARHRPRQTDRMPAWLPSRHGRAQTRSAQNNAGRKRVCTGGTGPAQNRQGLLGMQAKLRNPAHGRVPPVPTQFCAKPGGKMGIYLLRRGMNANTPPIMEAGGRHDRNSTAWPRP